VYGAVLTPKGMIVSDLWCARTGSEASLSVPLSGLDAFKGIVQRSFPPRIAQVHYGSAEAVRIIRLAGPAALDVGIAAGFDFPEPGRVAGPKTEAAITVARPPGAAPFVAEFVVPTDQVPSVLGELRSAGGVVAGPGVLELARILAGWPRLGAEIDDKTLPQEVRFDEINGVSYTKGCYTGQETVARVHFRGHPNRWLAGVVWRDTPDLDESEVRQDNRAVGRVTSVAWLAPIEQYVGLAVLRREVDRTELLTAAGAPARVVELPFKLNR